MEFLINRCAGVPVRDQLVAQIEMRILGGELAPGERLPSVRALARRLKLHPNTVSAAYQDLKDAGRVVQKHGSGVYVSTGGAAGLEQAESLDELIRLALALALRKGFSGSSIRHAVERWLAAAAPHRLLVVDREPELAELLARELEDAFGDRPHRCTVDTLAARPQHADGAVIITLPYHVEAVRRLAPTNNVRTVRLELSEGDRAAVCKLPEGSVVAVISASERVLALAPRLISSLRRDALLVETALLTGDDGWHRAVAAADWVFADALSAPTVEQVQPRRLRTVCLVAQDSLDELRPAIAAVLATGVTDTAAQPARRSSRPAETRRHVSARRSSGGTERA